jgi:hypothetical protein
MLRLVALVRTEVSEERRASIIRVTRMCELGITLAITSNRGMLRRNTMFISSCYVGDAGATFFRNVFLQEPRGVTSQKTALFKHK